tara:strand:- start:101 stop:217 length:117 start_codon:yes stop_codon:yes gene_type:complete
LSKIKELSVDNSKKKAEGGSLCYEEQNERRKCETSDRP